MANYLFLIPLSLLLGLVGLIAFFWALKSNQYDDLDGAAARVLEEDDQPLVEAPEEHDSVDKKPARMR